MWDAGGGSTIARLDALATRGRIYGVDYSEASAAASRRTNKRSLDAGRVEIQHASVSSLPFTDGMFDLVTAVETRYYWPDLNADTREILPVIKPGGMLVIIA
jgi:ubiquinone/menaquinone biosynthesis C-methylase UbiE